MVCTTAAKILVQHTPLKQRALSRARPTSVGYVQNQRCPYDTQAGGWWWDEILKRISSLQSQRTICNNSTGHVTTANAHHTRTPLPLTKIKVSSTSSGSTTNPRYEISIFLRKKRKREREKAKAFDDERTHTHRSPHHTGTAHLSHTSKLLFHSTGGFVSPHTSSARDAQKACPPASRFTDHHPSSNNKIGWTKLRFKTWGQGPARPPRGPRERKAQQQKKSEKTTLDSHWATTLPLFHFFLLTVTTVEDKCRCFCSLPPAAVLLPLSSDLLVTRLKKCLARTS